MTRNVLLVLGVALVAAAAWIVDDAQISPLAASHDEDTQRIDALLAGCRALEVSVLEARSGLQLSFDPLNRALAVLRTASSASDALQSRGPKYSASSAEVAHAATALQSEEAALEQFKTDLALLRLSSRYFPLAADALMLRAGAPHVRRTEEPVVPDATRAALADNLATLSALRTDLERYDEVPAVEIAQRAEAAMPVLQSLRSRLDDTARADLDVLLGHARSILDRRERVDRFARLLVRSPVRTHLEAARAAYERAARVQAHDAGVLRVLASTLALAGAGVLGVMAFFVIRERPRRPSRSAIR